MQDVVIIGGGVIGLSAAYELAGRGLQVTLLDARQPGREASWAGAGILPPGHPGDPQHPLVGLSRRTHELWPELSAELRETTGVDNGYRRCGGIGVVTNEQGADALRAEVESWSSVDVRVEPLAAPELAECESALAPQSFAYRLPELCQVRNPRHLKALQIACAQRNVTIRAGQPVVGFEQRGGQFTAARTPADRFPAGQFLITAGAWTSQLLPTDDARAPIEPVRGQIVLLSTGRPLFRHVIECGPRYLVPRSDGRVLVGSTEEWVGFDKQTTAQALKELLTFAESVVPELASARFERAWAGLRPCAVRGLPYLSRYPRSENAFVAAGHFRWGLSLSPVTARVMTQLMMGESTDAPLDAFAVDD